MDTREDDAEGVREWQQDEHTKFVLKGYVARLQKQYIELQGQALSGLDSAAMAVTAGRIDEIKGFIKVLGGGHA